MRIKINVQRTKRPVTVKGGYYIASYQFSPTTKAMGFGSCDFELIKGVPAEEFKRTLQTRIAHELDNQGVEGMRSRDIVILAVSRIA